MNIETAESTYNKARAAQSAGAHLEAARFFLTAQQQAQQCRSKRRVRIFDYAHAGASVQASEVLRASVDHAARSEAGRIRAESICGYRRGL